MRLLWSPSPGGGKTKKPPSQHGTETAVSVVPPKLRQNCRHLCALNAGETPRLLAGMLGSGLQTSSAGTFHRGGPLSWRNGGSVRSRHSLWQYRFRRRFADMFSIPWGKGLVNGKGLVILPVFCSRSAVFFSGGGAPGSGVGSRPACRLDGSNKGRAEGPSHGPPSKPPSQRPSC